MDQLFLIFIIGIPVAIDRKNFFCRVIDRHNVRRKAEVIFEVEIAIDLEHSAQAIFIVRRLFAAFDLVVCLLRASELRLLRRSEIDVSIHAGADTLLEFHLGDVLHMRLALCAVEACGAVGQVDIVDRNEQRGRAVLLLVPDQFQVLRATERHLREQLFHLWAELGHLVSELPVHELLLALCLLDLLSRDVTGDIFLHRTIRRQKLFANARREIDAGFGQHRVHDLRRALEIRAAGRVITKASAAQAFLILLVAQRAGFLIALNELKQLRRDHHAILRRHVFAEVRIELGVLCHVRLVESDYGRAVIVLFNIRVLVLHIDFLAESLIFVFHGLSFELRKRRTERIPYIWVLRYRGRHRK